MVHSRVPGISHFIKCSRSAINRSLRKTLPMLRFHGSRTVLFPVALILAQMVGTLLMTFVFMKATGSHGNFHSSNQAKELVLILHWVFWNCWTELGPENSLKHLYSTDPSPSSLPHLGIRSGLASQDILHASIVFFLSLAFLNRSS